METTQTTIAILKRTAEIIASEMAWATMADAQNEEGETVAPDDPTATCWCLSGALVRAEADVTGQISHPAFVPGERLANRDAANDALVAAYRALIETVESHDSETLRLYDALHLNPFQRLDGKVMAFNDCSSYNDVKDCLAETIERLDREPASG